MLTNILWVINFRFFGFWFLKLQIVLQYDILMIFLVIEYLRKLSVFFLKLFLIAFFFEYNLVLTLLYFFLNVFLYLLININKHNK